MYNQVSLEKTLELCRIMILILILMMFYNFTIKS
jgi:hypothetical protein